MALIGPENWRNDTRYNQRGSDDWFREWSNFANKIGYSFSGSENHQTVIRAARSWLKYITGNEYSFIGDALEATELYPDRFITWLALWRLTGE